MNVPSGSNSTDYFGEANYVMGRHRKNKVLVWQSKMLKGRVHEFVLATRFRLPGVFSWKCMHCTILRDTLKKKGVLNLQKVPLVLVDNDVIKEDPDRPNNAAHFCQGRDLVESAVLRSKLLFYETHEKTVTDTKEIVQQYVDEALNVVPFRLTVGQQRKARNTIDGRCTTVMERVISKRRKVTASAQKHVNSKIIHEKYDRSRCFIDDVPSCSKGDFDEVRCSSGIRISTEDGSREDVVDEYIDVEGDCSPVSCYDSRTSHSFIEPCEQEVYSEVEVTSEIV